MMNTEEQWEVEVGSEQYQIDLETIKSWIREGRVKTTDRVRKEGLDWARIDLVPQLRGVTADEKLIADLAIQRIRGELPEVPSGDRLCEACAEEIRAAALKCRHCGTVSIQPEWRESYLAYIAKDEGGRGAYWAAMEESERDFFKRVMKFSSAEGSGSQGASAQQADNSELAGYFYRTSNSSQWKTIFANSEEQAMELIARGLPPESSMPNVTAMPIGKFSCPRCGNRYTTSQRDIGCAIMIIIFISLGLGLIMIPFLPHTSRCAACEHRWKA